MPCRHKRTLVRCCVFLRQFRGVGACDVIVLQAGDKVVADVRLVVADSLEVDESLVGLVAGSSWRRPR
jgi:hypothetical protein